VKCDKIRCYEDRRFTSRLVGKVDVPDFTLREREMLSRKGKAAVAAGILMSTAMAGKSVAQPLDGESTPFASEQATNLPEGHVVADRFLGLIGSLGGWSDLTQEKLERAMGFKFAQGGQRKIFELRGRDARWISRYGYLLSSDATTRPNPRSYDIGPEARRYLSPLPYPL
jgi:type IV secretion system protein VirD4